MLDEDRSADDGHLSVLDPDKLGSHGGIGLYSLASLPALDPLGWLPWPFEHAAAHHLVAAADRLVAATDQGLLVFVVPYGRRHVGR